MRIIKFRIWNYKSIVDSGDCFLADKVTIFAGKNEAGKSSILEALSDFNFNSTISSKALPLEKTRAGGKPCIEVTFESTDIAILGIVEKLDLPPALKEQFATSLEAKPQLKVRKTYPSQYEITAEIFSDIQKVKPSEWSVLLTAFNATVSLLNTDALTKKLGLPKLGYDVYSAKNASEILSNYQTRVSESSQSLSADDLASVQASLAALKGALEQNAAQKVTLADKLRDAILQEIPKFILFSSFEDVFPNEVSFTDLRNNKWIADLSAMSDIDVDTILGSDGTARKRHKHALGLQINKDFSQFWTQDFSNLSIDWDSEKIQFWVQENDEFYPPEVRSQGRRWHLAFYIRVAARAREGKLNIILIDEPGLYLHATAQRDILKHLESSGGNCQILISTHSPYLIEPDKLERVRLVQKPSDRGTFIENKVHAVSDKETLTPILTAIGLELNQGIVGSDKLNNVVVEGPADYFYLTAFNVLYPQENLNFVSGGGAGNMPKVGTILQGWGARVIYLYDNDQAYKTAQRSIKREWATISKECLLALNIDGSIEDVFSKEEFASIFEVPVETVIDKNSLYLKANPLDKVLPARKYLERARGPIADALSDKTAKTVKALLKMLAEKF